MKVLAAVLVALSVLLGSVASHAGEPYAPKVKVPSGIKEDSPAYFSVMAVNAAIVPDKAAVGVPPYPGAKVIMTSSGMVMASNNDKLTCLNAIQLLTTDAPDKVIAFYKKRLKDYRFKSRYGGIINVFWKGAEKFNSADITQVCKTPNISITSESGNELMPEAKTMMEIVYEPGK